MKIGISCYPNDGEDAEADDGALGQRGAALDGEDVMGGLLGER